MKITTARLKYVKRKMHKTKRQIAGLKLRITQLETRRAALWLSCCDADCENDGNAHRPSCSVYKLKLDNSQSPTEGEK